MWPGRIESGVGRIESGMGRIESGVGRVEAGIERMDGKLDQVHEDLVDMRATLGDVRDEQRFAKESLRRIEIVLGDQNSLLTELRDDGRAQTRALLAILDRLDNGGAPARRPA